MIELPVTLTSTGGAVSFASPVTLGYTKNKGVYRLLITAEGEWQGLTIRCFWHLPGGTDPASSLVQDGFVDVPASVTAQPGTGCITFEGSDGEKTVTSADLRYKVGSNSGTEDGTMPEPGTPAWEQLVSETKANADAAERAKNDAQAAAEGVKTAAAKADEAAQKAEGAAQRAEAAQKATEQAEAAAAESIAGAKKEALSAISTGEQSALGAVQQAQTTATGAVQAAQTAAESAVSAAKTNAVQEVEAAAKPAQAAASKAEEAAERSAQAGIAASNAANDAAGSAVAAGNAASAAAGSESAAAKSAQAALESKTAAATSEGNAAASAKKAQDVADSLPVDYMTAVNEIAALKINKADKTELETVQKQIGNLDDLTTKAKETLVAAINEAARTGAVMRTDGGYIQYSTDDGSTWENLIALAELKGADGSPGADGYSPTASVEQSTDGAKITITDKSGTTEAVVKNGKDGANGRDGADGQPGRDGVNGQPGKDGTDGITPTIGDNGNWFLGATDTGKPSRGATGDTGTTGPQGPQGKTGPAGPQGPQGTDGKDAPQIDDTAITTTNPWSSKHIVDTLCPPLEESGNPVVCYPVVGYPLGVKAKWEPAQEGSGTPSPENIRPIKGRDSVTITRQEDNQVITLTLPETVYGGEVDAVSGKGQDTWKHVILNGTESWYTWGINANNPAVTGFFTYDIADYDVINVKGICSQLAASSAYVWGGANVGLGFATSGDTRYLMYCMPTSSLPDISAGHEVAALKAYLTAQYAARTPVQIAYKRAEPVPFTAAGAQPLAALAGANTVLTDADSATVTGRADPIKRISDLENKE